MKKRIFIPVILLSLIGLPMLFIYMSITNSTDCSQLVIDTYELHSKIDIPRVEFVNCYYNQDLDTRISVYELCDKMDLKQFEKVESTSQDLLVGIILLGDEEKPKRSNVYRALGKRWGVKWTYVIDPVENRLWAELNYDSK